MMRMAGDLQVDSLLHCLLKVDRLVIENDDGKRTIGSPHQSGQFFPRAEKRTAGQVVSPDEYEANLEGFVTALKDQGSKVILMTPNPLRWTDKLKNLYGKPPYDPDDPDGFNLLLTDYAERVRQIAARQDVPLVDSFRLFHEDEEHTVDQLLLDGMHPNDAGHAIEADALLEIIREMFPAEG